MVVVPVVGIGQGVKLSVSGRRFFLPHVNGNDPIALAAITVALDGVDVRETVVVDVVSSASTFATNLEANLKCCTLKRLTAADIDYDSCIVEFQNLEACVTP